jgi:hypothetical protein
MANLTPSHVEGSSNSILIFPLKMHQLLEATENRGQSHIISWLPGGTSLFKIHDKKKFANEVMPVYFATSNFRSFQRSLNLWDFKTEPFKGGSHKGARSHPYFQRGFPDLCCLMKRSRVKGTGPTRGSPKTISNDQAVLFATTEAATQSSARATKEGSRITTKTSLSNSSSSIRDSQEKPLPESATALLMRAETLPKGFGVCSRSLNESALLTAVRARESFSSTYFQGSATLALYHRQILPLIPPSVTTTNGLYPRDESTLLLLLPSDVLSLEKLLRGSTFTTKCPC